MTPELVVAEAREWLDTPYEHQRRTKGKACDCLGLVIGVARRLGLVVPGFDVNGYARVPDGKSLIAECDRYMFRIRNTAMRPGHVIVIRWELDPAHMGIVGDYAGGLSIIHALGTTDGKGRVVEHRLNSTNRRRVVQTYALPGVIY